MKEFKYFISKLDESFFGRSLSFTKAKNSFNKIYKEFLEKENLSEQIYNLLIPLERLFQRQFY